jgi:DNA-binding transcriptional regulator YbjK
MVEMEPVPLRELSAYLDRLDDDLATLEQLAHLAQRCAAWFDAHYAEVDTRRRELEEIVAEWQDVIVSFKQVSGVEHHEPTPTSSR